MGEGRDVVGTSAGMQIECKIGVFILFHDLTVNWWLNRKDSLPRLCSSRLRYRGRPHDVSRPCILICSCCVLEALNLWANSTVSSKWHSSCPKWEVSPSTSSVCSPREAGEREKEHEK